MSSSSVVALAVVVLAAITQPARAADTLKVDVPDAGCPRRKDVVAALEARVPGILRSSIVSVRRVALASEAPGTALLRLFDDRGGVVLERRLGGDAGARGKRADEVCQALAEAAAVVVARYLREIGYRPPAASVPDPNPAAPAPSAGEPRPTPTGTAPPAAETALDPTVAAGPTAPPAPTPNPPPSTSAPAASAPPAIDPAAPGGAPAAVSRAAAPLAPTSAAPWDGFVGVAAAIRRGPSSTDAARAEAVLALRLARGWFTGELAAGASRETSIDVPEAPGASLRLRAFPLRLALGAALPIAPLPGAIAPTLGLSADLLSFRAVALRDARSGVRFDPAAEAGLAYQAAGARFYLRAGVHAGLTLAPRDFALADRSGPVYRAPAGYLRGQIELGVRLWKNSGPSRL